MKIDYLREFLSLVKTKNYGEASDDLFISASALSRHIVAMENEFGVRLFRRSARMVSLSKEGKMLIPYAQSIVHSIDEYTELLSEEQQTKETMRIGYALSTIQYGIIDALLKFQHDCANVSLLLIDNTSESLWHMVENNECDFAFCYEYPMLLENREIETIPLITDMLMVAFPAKHPLASRKSVTLEDLKEESFIIQPKNSILYKTNIQLFKKAGYIPNISLYANGSQMLDMVKKGAGIAILEKKRFIENCPSEIKIVDLVPTVEKKLSMIYRKNKMNKTGKSLIEYIEKIYVTNSP